MISYSVVKWTAFNESFVYYVQFCRNYETSPASTRHYDLSNSFLVLSTDPTGAIINRRDTWSRAKNEVRRLMSECDVFAQCDPTNNKYPQEEIVGCVNLSACYINELCHSGTAGNQWTKIATVKILSPTKDTDRRSTFCSTYHKKKKWILAFRPATRTSFITIDTKALSMTLSLILRKRDISKPCSILFVRQVPEKWETV